MKQYRLMSLALKFALIHVFPYNEPIFPNFHNITNNFKSNILEKTFKRAFRTSQEVVNTVLITYCLKILTSFQYDTVKHFEEIVD